MDEKYFRKYWKKSKSDRRENMQLEARNSQRIQVKEERQLRFFKNEDTENYQTLLGKAIYE